MASLTRTRFTSKLFSFRNLQSLGKIIARNYASTEQMSFTFVAANQTFYYNQSVKQVDVPSFNGSFGILPNHVPVLAVLKPGVVVVYEDDGSTKKVFVSSGTVTVNDDSSVQILAEEAHLLESLDINSAQEALKAAEAELQSAKSDEEKADAQIAIEAGQAIIAAVHSGA